MRTRRTAVGLVRRTKNLGVKANVRRKTAAQARERLVTITDDVRLIQPAILVASGSDLVIVCILQAFWRTSSARFVAITGRAA